MPAAAAENLMTDCGMTEAAAEMTRSERDPLDLSAQAETVVGAGRGGLIMAMLGAGLLGWAWALLRARKIARVHFY